MPDLTMTLGLGARGVVGVLVPFVEPSGTWNGTAGTGFAVAPADPTRTTAKPAMRLLVPPNQRFTDDLLVGVAAAANNNGTLIGGVEKVSFHFEGATEDVLNASFHTFDDANDNPITYYGYWARLKRAGVNGIANLYVEAVPADATMQNRVIGPFAYSLQATQHDLELTINPDVAATGNNYHTFSAAIARIRTDNPANPRVTYKKALTNVAIGNTLPFTVTNYITVDSDFPITMGFASLDTTASVDSINIQRSRCGPLWLKGENITVDYLFCDGLVAETGHQWVLDGIVMTNSGGPGTFYRGGNNNAGQRVSGNPWFLECTINNIRNPCVSASLVRGGVLSDVSVDILSGSLCATGTRVERHSDDPTNGNDPAFTIVYAGAEATATLARSGGLDPTSCTYTFKWGANTRTFTTGRNASFYAAGLSGDNGYTFAHLVTWINTTLAAVDAGWSATIGSVPATRASSGSLLASKGQGFGDTNCKTTPLQIVSNFDLHGDWWQQVASQVENVVAYNNLAFDMQTQNIFLSPTTGPAHSRDMVFFNNAMSNDIGSGFVDSVVVSQLGRVNLAQALSHVVIAHVSMPNQGITFRNDGASFFSATDAYCLVANNAFRTLAKNVTTVGREPGAEIANNHIHTGQTPLSEATGTTIGGDRSSLFPGFNTGDFMPAGDLLTNLKTPIFARDLNKAQRAATDAVGAIKVTA